MTTDPRWTLRDWGRLALLYLLYGAACAALYYFVYPHMEVR
jgi:hypothetical protein